MPQLLPNSRLGSITLPSFLRADRMSSFKPVNTLELEMVEARAARTPIQKIVALLGKFELVVPSGGEVMGDGSGFRPLLFDKQGVQMVACFTALERIGKFGDLAPYCLTINGAHFMRLIPHGFGLVVNPGHSVGFDITPDGLKTISAEINAPQ